MGSCKLAASDVCKTSSKPLFVGFAFTKLICTIRSAGVVCGVGAVCGVGDCTNILALRSGGSISLTRGILPEVYFPDPALSWVALF
ncbi:hypothetical protein DP113_20015 [Brasilonema octagenarum UFV-E1]|uniref:Uncharacterized protein n=1 Tax=Brasilonema sennae CENA114 TaxID=415709 RepID=A0A856ML10_9CYAN|nr:hypothetical protein [Brasilonema sennae]QDL09877.1 hypothetical protein DP114_20100 [Brasilonema sennae CENA114]QDL16227.1 hypothetical protein DP113_20015 [Brasilonema octagenarum UFV-E1]